MDQIKDNKESAPLLKYLSIIAFFIAVIILGFWLTRPLTKTKIEISRVGEKANVIHGGKLRIGDSIQTEKVTHFEFIEVHPRGVSCNPRLRQLLNPATR